MISKQNQFTVFKKILPNGMTILVKPSYNIPRIEAHILYNVGSKDETSEEKGVAHFIEHMLFKGTKKFSETDINMIAHKLSGSANAFTSQDFTGYQIRLPSSTWKITLSIFAECMQNARFDSEMILSEIKTVIEELRMYRDDYQNIVLENLMAAIWPEHPYHNPVVGSHYDLCNITQKKLFSFYKKHYHPLNATLVIVGHVSPEDVFAEAEKIFGNIPSPKYYKKNRFFFHDDIASENIVIHRNVNTPWCCYAYKIPGACHEQSYIFDIAALILCNGKSSRLYRRLVDKEQLVVDIDCSIANFFEKGLFCISLYPTKIEYIPVIERIISEEIEKLHYKSIQGWELQGAQKKAQIDYTSLLESLEKQATLIGTAYLATQKENFLDYYFAGIEKLTAQDIQQFFKEYLSSSVQHHGYLLPISPEDSAKLIKLQQTTEQAEDELLRKHARTKPMELGSFSRDVESYKPMAFSYPKPETFVLPNGLNVIYHHSPNVPNVAIIVKFKANSLYDDPEKTGCFQFLLRMLTDSTAKYSAQELNKKLETEGIYVGSVGESLAAHCLSNDFEKTLAMVVHILTEPSFNATSFVKIKNQITNQLTEYWDTPIEYIDQIARDYIYQTHPYSRDPDGTLNSVSKITQKDLKTCYQTNISPDKGNLVIVGDLSNIKLKELILKYFTAWTGPSIAPLQLPPFVAPKPKNIHMPAKRDQVAMVFVAPSIERTSHNFYYLALLDIILTGGPQLSANSRLFELREKSGLFYAIGGSLVHGSREAPGMMFIKTIVSPEKLKVAQKLILDTIDNLGKNGVTEEEFFMAKNIVHSSSVELFETNFTIAQTFLFLKRFNLNFNLFDKQGELLSILKIETMNDLAREYCNRNRFSVITVGKNY